MGVFGAELLDKVLLIVVTLIAIVANKGLLFTILLLVDLVKVARLCGMFRVRGGTPKVIKCVFTVLCCKLLCFGPLLPKRSLG